MPNTMTVAASDLHYEYNTRGYMLYYKGKPIGGAGIGPEAKGCGANLKLFRECADREKKNIIDGYGERRYYDAMRKIDEEAENDGAADS